MEKNRKQKFLSMFFSYFFSPIFSLFLTRGRAFTKPVVAMLPRSRRLTL